MLSCPPPALSHASLSPPKPFTSLCGHPWSWAHTPFPCSSHTPVPSLLSLSLLVGWRPRLGHFGTGQSPCVNSPAFLSRLLPGAARLRHPGLFLPEPPAAPSSAPEPLHTPLWSLSLFSLSFHVAFSFILQILGLCDWQTTLKCVGVHTPQLYFLKIFSGRVPSGITVASLPY